MNIPTIMKCRFMSINIITMIFIMIICMIPHRWENIVTNMRTTYLNISTRIGQIFITGIRIRKPDKTVVIEPHIKMVDGWGIVVLNILEMHPPLCW